MIMYKNCYILLLLLLFSACSSDEGTIGYTGGIPANGETVSFSASVVNGGAGIRANNTDVSDFYLHNSFLEGTSRIRIVNTVNYSIPDFTDENGYYEYINQTVDGDDPQAGEGGLWDPDVEANFFPYDATTEGVNHDLGIKWEDIMPTSGAYVFEAACYPMTYQPFDNVATDQRTRKNFWTADLLLAHHAMPLSDIYSLVKLRFWHVFCMVRATITLDIAGENTDEGFPLNALGEKGDDNSEIPLGSAVDAPGMTLNQMQTGYEVEYAGAIQNDGCRVVKATGNRDDIQMFLVSVETDEEKQQQTYVYAAIIPFQSIRTDQPFVNLRINTIVGFDENMEKQITQLKDYVFIPDRAININQGHITDLKLKFESDNSQPILLSAKVNPWNESYTDVNLTPKGTDEDKDKD